MDSGTCIDNFLSNLRNAAHEVLEFTLSDHTAQLFEIPVKQNIDLKCWFVEKRDYHRHNIDKFIQCINALSFQQVFESDDPNISFTNFYELFTLFYYLCLPVFRIKGTPNLSLNGLPKELNNVVKKKNIVAISYESHRT